MLANYFGKFRDHARAEGTVQSEQTLEFTQCGFPSQPHAEIG
jgi:hypothetical protein